MPTVPHVEKHFTATETVRDVVIGMADGLTVPFAFAAGLSAAVTSTKVIVTAEKLLLARLPWGLAAICRQDRPGALLFQSPPRTRRVR